MKQKPRWTLEMLTASLAVLCGLLVLVLLVQRPMAWPALLAVGRCGGAVPLPAAQVGGPVDVRRQL